MESKTKNRKTRKQIAAMVERAFGGVGIADGDDAVKELEEGWFNAVYDLRLGDGREVILKVAPLKSVEVLAYEKGIMATEVACMRLVSQNPGIPVPEIFYFDASEEVCDSDYFFMAKLTGDNYEHVRGSFAPELKADVDQQIGGIIREINGFTGDYFGYDGNSELRGEGWRETFIKIVDAVLEDGRRKDADFGFGYDEIRDAVVKHSGSLDEVKMPQLVHWDAWDLNFFVKDGKITGILDFERALWADPLMEAQFRALAFGSGEVSESMKGYGKTTFTHAEMVRCNLYTLYLALVMKTECYYRNYDSDFVSDMALQLMRAALGWLREN